MCVRACVCVCVCVCVCACVCVCVCVCVYQISVDVPVVIHSGCTIIDVVEFAPDLDIWQSIHLPARKKIV